MTKQIIKVQKDKRAEESIKIKTKDWSGSVIGKTKLEEALLVVFARILNDNPEIFHNWQANLISLNGLEELIQQDYTINIVETKDIYNLIVSKNKCSTSFSATKEQGIANVFEQAEDWAQTMLEELNVQISN